MGVKKAVSTAASEPEKKDVMKHMAELWLREEVQQLEAGRVKATPCVGDGLRERLEPDVAPDSRRCVHFVMKFSDQLTKAELRNCFTYFGLGCSSCNVLRV